MFGDVLVRLRDSSLLQAIAQDGLYHASLYPLVKDWIILHTDKSTCQENTCMAEALVADVLKNSWQKENFDLLLRIKQNLKLHIIVLEENYQDFFILQPCIPSGQKALDKYISLLQPWFVKLLRDDGSYHLAEIISQRVHAQNKNVLGVEHPDTLASMVELATIFWYQCRWKEAEELL